MSSWAHTTGQAVYASSTTVNQLTLTATLAANPTSGDVVCVGVISFGAGITVTVKDGAGTPNNYIQAAKDATQDSTAGTSWLFYLIAGATANSAITATFSSNPNGVVGMYVDEFTPTGGSAVFDTGLGGHAAGATSPTVQPSITPANTGELLYSHAVFSTGASGVSGVAPIWTQNGHGTGAFGEDAAWILSSASGSTTTHYTFTGTQDYDATIMAFLISSGNVPEDQYFTIPLPRLADPAISIWG